MTLWTGERWRYDWFDDATPEQIGCGELLACIDPERVLREHRELLAAGADAISTITFGAVAAVMEEYGLAARAAEANYENARLARMACDEFSTPARPRKVLGGMGPTLHLLSLQGGGAERAAQMEAEYRVQAEALVRGGVDVLHIDCCMDRENMRAAMRAIASLGVAVPVCITGEFEEMGSMLDGATPVDFFDCARELGARWVGVTGRMWPTLWAWRTLEEAGRMPDAVLPAVFWPGSEIGWMETAETLLAGLAPVIAGGRVPIVGVGRVPRVDFVAALAAELVPGGGEGQVGAL